MRRRFWNLFQLALAAALLAVDIRFFLFFAFIVLVTIAHRINYLRAAVCAYHAYDDVRFVLLLRHAGVSKEEATAVSNEMHDDLNSDIQESLDRDVEFVCGVSRTQGAREWFGNAAGGYLGSSGKPDSTSVDER